MYLFHPPIFEKIIMWIRSIPPSQHIHTTKHKHRWSDRLYSTGYNPRPEHIFIHPYLQVCQDPLPSCPMRYSLLYLHQQSPYKAIPRARNNLVNYCTRLDKIEKMSGKRSCGRCRSVCQCSTSEETWHTEKGQMVEGEGKWNDKSLNTSAWLRFEMADRYHVAVLKYAVYSHFQEKLTSMRNYRSSKVPLTFVRPPSRNTQWLIGMHGWWFETAIRWCLRVRTDHKGSGSTFFFEYQVKLSTHL